MPMKKGSGKKTIAKNIAMEVKAGEKPKKAIAMAMKKAGKAKKKK